MVKGRIMAIALVTGPTSGLGRGYARALARKGFDLVLVSRSQGDLLREADEITNLYGVNCEVLVADLSSRDDIERVEGRLRDADRPISVLVNNAGFGLKTSFARSTVADEQALLDVLVTAVMRLTRAVLPGMLDRGAGWIVTVSSVASWFPGGSYSAAKAWATTFSESMSVELRGTGVRAIAVCPGFVRTEFHARADMNMSGTPDWMWLSVDDVVDRTWRDLALGKSTSVASIRYRAVALALRRGPSVIGKSITHVRQRGSGMGARR